MRGLVRRRPWHDQPREGQSLKDECGSGLIGNCNDNYRYRLGSAFQFCLTGDEGTPEPESILQAPLASLDGLP